MESHIYLKGSFGKDMKLKFNTKINTREIFDNYFSDYKKSEKI